MNSMNNEKRKRRVIANFAFSKISSDLRICSSPCKQEERGDKMYPHLFKNRKIPGIFCIRKKKDDSSFCFGFAKVLALSFLLSLNLSTSYAAKCLSNGKLEGSNETCKSCGPNCNWELIPLVDEENKPIYVSGTEIQAQKLSVTAERNLDNAYISGTAWASGQPWYSSRDSITSVDIGEGISSLGTSSFGLLTKVTSVSIPNSVKKIGDEAFQGMSSLQHIDIPDSVTSIGSAAFRKAGLSGTLIIPDSVEKISSEAFAYISDVTSLILPNSVDIFGYGAFRGMSGLTSVTLPTDGTLGEHTFTSCSNLNELIVPENIDVSGWHRNVFNDVYSQISNIKCIGDERNCIENLSSLLLDDNGKCQKEYCFSYLQKIGNTCVGKYFANATGDGTCVQKAYCTRNENYVVNLDTRKCMLKTDCSNGYIVDEKNKRCMQLPGCNMYAEGVCQECKSGYLKQSGACIEESACNGRNYASGDECKEMPEGCIGMSGDSCATCDGEHLEKDGSCISISTGCGAGYKQFEDFCNRIQYTPAEAAEVLRDDNTNSVTITFKK